MEIVEQATSQDAPTPEAPPAQYVKPPEDPELNKSWQEFLQKCCEAGQLDFQLKKLDGQKRALEKQLEVTQRAVEKAANHHDQLRKNKMEAEKNVAQSTSQNQNN